MNKRNNSRRVWRNTQLFVENAVTNNIVLIQALGLCPIIAAGDTLQKGVALTACTPVVLIPLSFFIALVGNWLPKWLRPAIYVALAAGLLGVTALLTDRYLSTDLYAQLYLYIPLMAVNLLYTRSVGFSSIVNPVATVVDALGSTVGFGMVICLISLLREVAIYSTVWGNPVNIAITVPAAANSFFAYILLGFMAALLQWSRQRITAFFHNREEDDQ